MKSLKSALTLLCFGVFAASAPAQEGTVPDSEMSQAYIQGLSGRYVGGSAGNDTTYGLSAVGDYSSSWHPMESFRLELEYAYRDRDAALLTAPSTDATVGTLGSMANARFNVRVADWLTPYVGVGLGWTRNEAERLALGYADQRAEVLTYQGVVGLSVPFSDGLSLFADGRFLRGAEPGFTATDDFSTHGSVQTWTALAGVRFTFGK